MFSNPEEKAPQNPANPVVSFKFKELACRAFPVKPRKISDL
jgi:hypothetical protein